MSLVNIFYADLERCPTCAAGRRGTSGPLADDPRAHIRQHVDSVREQMTGETEAEWAEFIRLHIAPACRENGVPLPTPL